MGNKISKAVYLPSLLKVVAICTLLCTISESVQAACSLMFANDSAIVVGVAAHTDSPYPALIQFGSHCVVTVNANGMDFPLQGASIPTQFIFGEEMHLQIVGKMLNKFKQGLNINDTSFISMSLIAHGIDSLLDVAYKNYKNPLPELGFIDIKVYGYPKPDGKLENRAAYFLRRLIGMQMDSDAHLIDSSFGYFAEASGGNIEPYQRMMRGYDSRLSFAECFKQTSPNLGMQSLDLNDTSRINIREFNYSLRNDLMTEDVMADFVGSALRLSSIINCYDYEVMDTNKVTINIAVLKPSGVRWIKRDEH